MQQNSSIFRQAAIDAQKNKHLGKPMLQVEKHFIYIAVMLVAILGFAIWFTSSFTFSKTVDVRGWIDTETPSIAIRPASEGGVVEEILVKNGNAVKKGQVLFKILRSPSIMQTQSQLQNDVLFEHKHYQLESSSLNNKLEHLLAQITENKKQAALLQEKRAVLKQQSEINEAQVLKLSNDLVKTKVLVNQGLISVSDYEALQSRVLSAKAQLANNKMQIIELRSAQIQNEQELGEYTRASKINQKDFALLEHRYQSKLASLKRERSYILKAPIDGYLTNMRVGLGDTVSANQSLGNIYSVDSPLIAYIYLPSQKANFVRERQAVHLKIDGFDYKRYGTIKSEISHIAAQISLPMDAVGAPISLSSPAYLSQLTLSVEHVVKGETTWPIKPGMLISASIDIEQISILDWLSDSLFSTRSSHTQTGFVNGDAK